MPFINIDDADAIAALQPGEFALPTMIIEPDILLFDSPRLRGSIQAMKTVLTNVGFGHIAAMIGEIDDGTLPEQLAQLEQDFTLQMQAYLAEPVEEILLEIFHKIQLWGGRSGRNIYVMGGGFAANFNFQAYAEFVACATSPAEVWHNPDPRIPQLQICADRIRQFGVSFSTKHARFWTQAADVVPLPIYDKILANGCFGYDIADWDDYSEFTMALRNAAAIHMPPIAIDALERHAFNSFGTPEGVAWLNSRVA